jgi:hypothetical protein
MKITQRNPTPIDCSTPRSRLPPSPFSSISRAIAAPRRRSASIPTRRRFPSLLTRRRTSGSSSRLIPSPAQHPRVPPIANPSRPASRTTEPGLALSSTYIAPRNHGARRSVELACRHPRVRRWPGGQPGRQVPGAYGREMQRAPFLRVLLREAAPAPAAPQLSPGRLQAAPAGETSLLSSSLLPLGSGGVPDVLQYCCSYSTFQN